MPLCTQANQGEGPPERGTAANKLNILLTERKQFRSDLHSVCGDSLRRGEPCSAFIAQANLDAAREHVIRHPPASIFHATVEFEVARHADAIRHFALNAFARQHFSHSLRNERHETKTQQSTWWAAASQIRPEDGHDVRANRAGGLSHIS